MSQSESVTLIKKKTIVGQGSLITHEISNKKGTKRNMDRLYLNPTIKLCLNIRKNPDVQRQTVATYQAANPEQHRQSAALYQVRNTDVHRVIQSRYRENTNSACIEMR